MRQLRTPCCSESPEPRVQSRTSVWRGISGRSGGGAAGHDIRGGRCRRNRNCHVCCPPVIVWIGLLHRTSGEKCVHQAPHVARITSSEVTPASTSPPATSAT